MLCILKGLGFLAFIPATMLLTVSCFVQRKAGREAGA